MSTGAHDDKADARTTISSFPGWGCYDNIDSDGCNDVGHAAILVNALVSGGCPCVWLPGFQRWPKHTIRVAFTARVRSICELGRLGVVVSCFIARIYLAALPVIIPYNDIDLFVTLREFRTDCLLYAACCAVCCQRSFSCC